MSFPYIEKALDYATSVVNGEIPACKLTIAACKRQLDDLERWHDADSPYRFDPVAAERICKLAEKLPHIKGEWAKNNENIVLEPFQCFIYTTVFGWLDRKGNRRFRRAYVEIPRRNGKSTFSAPVGIFMLAADGEAGSDVYSAATTRDQAKIVFKIAHQMAKKRPKMLKHYGMGVLTNNIHIISTASKFEPLSADYSTLDGLDIHCAIVDELHAHKTRQVFDVIETGTGSRAQPLIWIITTAGDNLTGVCYEQHEYIVAILNKVIEDETYFGVVYSIDPGMDWQSEEAWAMANPNYGVSVQIDDMRSLAKKASQSSQSQGAFKMKRLNIWVNAGTAFMPMDEWHKCADRSLKLEDFKGEKCFIGLDLSSKLDVTSKIYLFKRRFADVEKIIIFGKHYLPEERVHAEGLAKTAHYEAWAKDGHLLLTSGNMIDLDLIEQGIREDMDNFDVVEIGYDPWQASQMVGHLLAESAPMIEVRPGVAAFSEPMKMIEGFVISKTILHDGNPVLTWMTSNVISKSDAKDNIYPRKAKDENKIDGFVALLTSLNRLLSKPDEGESIYEQRGLAELEY